jgi:hypothetical protein
VHARSAIHWFIDHNDAMMYLAVAVRAEGWLGFGVSENGGMLGSDILLLRQQHPIKFKMDICSLPVNLSSTIAATSIGILYMHHRTTTMVRVPF